MRRTIVATIAALGVAGCATKPITSDEFYTHGRFKAEQCETVAAPPAVAPASRRAPVKPPKVDEPALARCRYEAREKAFAECRAQAMQDGTRAGQQYQGPGLAGAIGQSIAARNTAILTVSTCMDSKGFGWSSPR